jgi:xylulokinase
MALALGIDFGSSGVRAIAIDESANITALVKTSYDIADWSSWQLALWRILGALPLRVRTSIRAIAIDGTSGTVLAVDGQGQPLAPPLLYNFSCDRSIQEYLHYLVPEHSPARSSTSSLGKLLTLQAQLGVNRPAYFLHQADWLAYLLHGRLGISDYHNALKLGYDIVNLRYPDWFPDTWLRPPEVLSPSQPIGNLLPAVAQEFSLPRDCIVCAGTTDSTAACIASLGTLPNPTTVGMTALGSTLVIKAVSPVPIFHSAYGIYSHRWQWQGGTYYLAGGASNTGGAVLKQFFSEEELQTLSQQIDPAKATPLRYYPLGQPGERFPVHDPHLPPQLEPRPADPVAFLHGLLESMAHIEKQGYGLLNQLGCPLPEQIITTGGGAKNLIWQAIRQRVIGVPVSQASCTEAAFGTALMLRHMILIHLR